MVVRATPGLRDLWDAGEVTLGGWCAIPSPFSAELMGQFGFDWVTIDTQHGLVGYDRMLTMLQGLSNSGTPAFVRVSWNQPGEIMKALDAGAQGVIVPMVNTHEEALRATRACRYPPHGIRSWGPTRAALRIPGYTPEVGNRLVICAVMLETTEAIDRIDQILDVPGIDAVFIGPNDLAISAGLAPDSYPPEPVHMRLIETILSACRRRNLVAGISCASVEQATKWRDMGFRMLALQSDALLLRRASEGILRELRGTHAGEPSRGSTYA